jgi:hypothetical protein
MKWYISAIMYEDKISVLQRLVDSAGISMDFKTYSINTDNWTTRQVAEFINDMVQKPSVSDSFMIRISDLTRG